MKKARKQTPDSRKTTGLPPDTEWVTFSLLTSEDDPNYARLTMTSSLRSAPRGKTRDRD